ncbi:MAG: ATP-binding protein [Eubacteriaceae bacterium]|nr:ATP-binding protein [Eubacteriaceae bacterium]
MRFKAKMLATNGLIAFLLLAATCVALANGLYSYAVSERASNLLLSAKGVSLMMTESLRGIEEDTTTPQAAYRRVALQIVENVHQAYSYKAQIFDAHATVLASTLTDVEEGDVSSFVMASISQNTSGYVLTKVSGASYMIFFSPMAIDGEIVGALALYYPTTAIYSILNRTVAIFCVAGAVVAVVCMFLFNATYKKIFAPISAIAATMRQMEDGDSLPKLDIVYSVNDEIMDLMQGYRSMADKIESNIEALSYEKDKLLSLISSMQDAVIAVNLSNVTFTTNDKFNEFFPSDVDYFAIVSHLDQVIHKVTTSKEHLMTEFAYEDKNYLISASLVANPNTEDGALIVIKDITPIRKMELEQQKFISSISHELRTPLTTITGYIDMLQRRGVDNKELTEKALDTTKKETERLLRLVNDLLSVNSSKTGFDYIFTDFEPDELIFESVSEMNVKAAEKRVVVTYSRVELPLIRADRDRIKQVLINIIDNAVKYSNPDDVVRVLASNDEEYLEIDVRDYGEGIPENKRDRIFDTFYRVEEDRNRLRGGGVGLGLSIVKNIVNYHNGIINVESMPEQGTLFTVKLPITQKKESQGA